MSRIELERPTSELARRPATVYAPDILPLLQSLLGTLADIDYGFERDLEAVAKSAVDEPFKQKAAAALRQRHRERRAPYLREITDLQRRIEATFA